MKKIFIEIMNKNPRVKSQSKICHHKKIFIEILNKKIRVLNHSQKFMSSLKNIY